MLTLWPSLTMQLRSSGRTRLEPKRVLAIFKDWLAVVENQTYRTLKCLRSNNGGEFKMDEFVIFYRHYGIRWEFMAAHSLEQNGIANSMNQIIPEQIVPMPNHSRLSDGFWAEALLLAVHIINMSPNKPLGSPPSNVRAMHKRAMLWSATSTALTAAPACTLNDLDPMGQGSSSTTTPAIPATIDELVSLVLPCRSDRLISNLTYTLLVSIGVRIWLDEVFSPLVKMTTLLFLLSVFALEHLELLQLDIKKRFLHGDLNEENFME